MEELDRYFLSLAMDEAWKYQGLTYPNPAVGAVVARGRELVALECHKMAGSPHAEVHAIKSAFLKLHTDTSKTSTLQSLTDSLAIHQFLYDNHDGIFADCTIYSTLEPCNHYGKTPPCAELISRLGFERIVFGSSDFGEISKNGAERIANANIKIDTGVMRAECDRLLEPFVMWQKKRFVFFKYAQTLNGVIGPGKISCDASFEMVHMLRDKIDLILIGGQTVRNDRPTLDSRLVNGRAPDVMIYSRQKEFDESIPLFSVPNRNVIISNELVIPDKYKFVMIEGGSAMLQVCQELFTHALVFVAPKISSGTALSINCIDFEYLNSFTVGNDIAIWMKRRAT